MKTRFILKLDQPLDVSGLRLFLFNQLAAKAGGGTVAIRTESTNDANFDATKKIFSWLGLNWDEGLGHGSARSAEVKTAAYKKYLDQLVAEGKAYPCYCSEERLKESRSRQTIQGKRPRYDGHCRGLTSQGRGLTSAQKEELQAQRQPQIRVQLDPEGPLTLHEQVGGERSLPRNLVEDYVIARADGSVAKNFSVAVDDMEEGITDLIIGEDDLPNLFQQSIFRKLLAQQEPQYTLIPVLLDTDHGLLAKKGEAFWVKKFQQDGFLPRGLVRYLISCGWPQSLSYPLEEIAEHFKEAQWVRSSPVFDIAALRDINGECLQEIAEDNFLALSRPYVGPCPDALFATIARGARPYLKTLAELGAYAVIVMNEAMTVPPDFVPLLRTERAKNSLRFIIQELAGVESFASETMSQLVEATAAKFKIKTKSVWTPLQIALTGEGGELVMDPIPHLLGKEKVQARLQQALHLAEALEPPVVA